MAEPEEPERWYTFRLRRVVVLLFFLFATLMVIDLVAITSLGTNASKTFESVQQQVGSPQSTSRVPGKQQGHVPSEGSRCLE